MIDAILEYYRRSARVIARGAPLVRLTELPCRLALMRAKSKIANTDESGLATLKQQVIEDLTPIEAQYQ